MEGLAHSVIGRMIETVTLNTTPETLSPVSFVNFINVVDLDASQLSVTCSHVKKLQSSPKGYY